MKAFAAVFLREASAAWAGGSGALLPVLFFLATLLLVPLGVGGEAARLSSLAAGLCWLAAALGVLLTLERMFQADLECGAVALAALSPVPLELVVLAKCLAHWAISGLALSLAVPLAGLLMAAPGLTGPSAIAVVLTGSLSFYLWGGVGAALTAGLNRSSALVALLVLPLFVPTVIFGAEVLSGIGESDPVTAPVLFVFAGALAALAIAPFAMAAALRAHLD